MELSDCKILLLGGNNVGKSCIFIRYVKGSLPERILATIGVDYRTHYTEVEYGVKVKLQIWDTAGHERFWPTTRSYVAGTDGFLMVFDLGDLDSFTHVEYLYREVCEILQSHTAHFVLVGHKCDQNQRKVDRERAEMMASEWNAPYYEVSARTGYNVAEIFELLARRVYQSRLWDYESFAESDGDTHS